MLALRWDPPHLVSQSGPHPKTLIQVWMGSQWEGLPETNLGEGGNWLDSAADS